MTNETLIDSAQTTSNTESSSESSLLDGVKTEGNKDSSNGNSNVNNTADNQKGNETTQNTDNKQTENKTTETNKVGAPEKYEFKMPEGMQPIPEIMEKFSTLAKEMNLSQEQAQKLVSLQSDYVNFTNQQIMKEYETTTSEWKKESVEKLGAKMSEELKYAAAFIDANGGQELRKFLNDTRIGDHYLILNAFAKAGRLYVEDGFVEGKRGNTGPIDPAKVLYPNMK